MKEAVEEILIEELNSMGQDLTSTQLRNLFQECLYDGDIEIYQTIKMIMEARNENL